MSDPEVALMLAFARGEEAAFVTLYRTYRDRMIGYCQRMLGDRARAEEAAQDVFIKLYQSKSRYQERARFSTFLYRIATHHCLNLRAHLDRKLVERGRELSEEAHSSGGGTPHDALETDQLRVALGAALSVLPDKQRAAFVLVHHQGLDYRAAAEVLDVTESAMKSLIHRARETLTRELASIVQEPREVSRVV